MQDTLKPLMRHHIDMRASNHRVTMAVCGEVVTEEQIGAQTSQDRDSWGLFVEVSVMCKACREQAMFDDDDEDDLENDPLDLP